MVCYFPWYLYQTVAQNMMRTYDAKKSFPKKNGSDDSFDVTDTDTDLARIQNSL